MEHDFRVFNQASLVHAQTGNFEEASQVMSHTLMNDAFGNYVIQEMIQHGNFEQRDQFCQLIVV